MATITGGIAYGQNAPAVNVSPAPFVSLRSPLSTDFAPIGTVWINRTTPAAYTLVNIASGQAVWQTTTGGAGTFGSLVVGPGTTAITSNVNSGTAISLAATNATGGVSISGANGASVITTDQNGVTLTTPSTSQITLSSSGNVVFAFTATTIASPTAAATSNHNTGMVIFTGFTTAAAATQAFTITNNTVTATSRPLVAVSNGGTNNALMTVTGVKYAVGSFVVTLTNNGTQALNGDVNINWIGLAS